MRLLNFLRSNAWLFAACLIVGSIYWHAHQALITEKQQYADKFTQLEREHATVLLEQVKLKRHLKNREEPQWIEWHLMYHLGLIPEGSTKVLVKDEKDFY